MTDDYIPIQYSREKLQFDKGIYSTDGTYMGSLRLYNYYIDFHIVKEVEDATKAGKTQTIHISSKKAVLQYGFPGTGIISKKITFNVDMNILLEECKKRFPDCHVTLDSILDYRIIIDWS